MKRSLYAIMVPFFSTVEDFVTKGKVPVVYRPLLRKCTDEAFFFLFWRLNSDRSLPVETMMYDSVVVLTNVLYIFLLVLIRTRELVDRGDGVFAFRVIFGREGSFIKVFHQSEKCIF